MKRKFIKKTVSALLSVILIFTLTFGISAHEMYYTSSGSPVTLRWSVLSNGKCYIKINGDKINSSGNFSVYNQQYNNCKYAWSNSISSLITIVEEDNFTTSNVDVATATESYWDSMFDTDNYYSISAFTRLSDTNNNAVTNLTSAINSTGNIDYAAIFMSPFVAGFGGDNTYIKRIIVHEIGHALTLGHPNTIYYPVNDASVMRQDDDEATYYTPRTHDINDIMAKYD